MAKAKAKEKETDEKEEKEEKPEKTEDGDTDAEGEGAEGEGAPKKSKKKIIIIGLLALLLLLAGLGAAYYFGMFGAQEEHAAVELGPDGKPIEKPIFYTLPEFLVNLNTGGKQSSFLKATVILEVAQQGEVPQVEANLPRLLDAINTYLRELRPSDLAGSAGIQRLREELLLRANKTLAPIKINDVLFKEIIVQ
jgi:flagellar protein FliL